MAAKNSVKIYSADSLYHLYNRGVEKREIFSDQQDFAVFLSYLKTYLLPKDEVVLQETLASPEVSYKERGRAIKLLRLNNFASEIELLTYALLPNHFHFLVWQKNPDGIDRFMNALGTRYSTYFNRKYRRVGPLYQGVYKAVIVKTDEQLLHLSRYIHLNPFKILKQKINHWQEITWPFSLPEYFQARNTPWVKPNRVLNYFSKTSKNNSYQNFMGESLEENENKIIAPLTLDEF